MSGERPRACANCGCRVLLHGKMPAQTFTFNMLPGTGLIGSHLEMMVCSECGALSLFVPSLPLGKLAESKQWKRVEAEDAG